MVVAHLFRILSAVLFAAALVAAPLANPLLASALLILGGALAAWRGAADLGLVTGALGLARGVAGRCRA